MRSFERAKKEYRSDSTVFIEVVPFLNQQLKAPIQDSEYSTWQVDSLSKIADVGFRNSMSHFFSRNQLKSGSLFDDNTVYFYFAANNGITDIETCNTLDYMLVYVKDDKAPVYSGDRSCLNNKFKWFKTAAHWYLLALVNRGPF